MRTRLVALTLTLALAAPGLSGAEEYDPQRAGHPLKVIYYVLYPVGLTLDWLIFRPAWYIGRVEPFRTLFGVPEPAPAVPDKVAPPSTAEPQPESD